MFSQKQRISHRLFTSLSSPKKVFSAPKVSLRVFLLPESVIGPRYMITMGKKDGKTAVMRNRMKRRYASIVKTCIPKNSSKHGFQIIVKKAALAQSFQEARLGVEKLFQSIHP